MGCYTMTPDEDGAYVKAEVYDELAEDNAALRLAVERLRAERDALTSVVDRVKSAWTEYERHGAICEFEGAPMIYVATLEELHDAAIALAEQQEGDPS